MLVLLLRSLHDGDGTPHGSCLLDDPEPFAKSEGPRVPRKRFCHVRLEVHAVALLGGAGLAMHPNELADVARAQLRSGRGARFRTGFRRPAAKAAAYRRSKMPASPSIRGSVGIRERRFVHTPEAGKRKRSRGQAFLFAQGGLSRQHLVLGGLDARRHLFRSLCPETDFPKPLIDLIGHLWRQHSVQNVARRPDV